MSASWRETQDCSAEVSMTKWRPFCLFIFILFAFLFLVGSRWFQLHTLLCLHRWQRSVYFIPNRSHCCTEGIVFLFRVNANVQTRHFVWKRYKHEASRYCSAVDVWNMATNVSASVLRTSREISSAALKSLSSSVSRSCCADRSREETNPSNYWKSRFLTDRQTEL